MTDLYNRAVLPDEIDADPVEPAPDEGLVERAATEAQLAFQSAGTWEAATRAVLAEIAQADRSGGVLALYEKRVAELEGMLALNDNLTPVLQTHKKRVAELEAELTYWSNRAGTTEGKVIGLESDLAAVTRERDELASRHGIDCVNAQRRIDSLTRELAEAKEALGCRDRVLDTRGEEIRRLDKELADWKASAESRADTINALNAQLTGRYVELAEAREELRVLDWFMLGDIGHAQLKVRIEQIRAHRAKTSDSSASPAKAESGAGEQASGTTATDGSELPYETAPRLKKGDEVRLLKAGVHVGSDFVVRVSPHDGQRVLLRESGWRNVRDVVRVEPEKAREPSPTLEDGTQDPASWEAHAAAEAQLESDLAEAAYWNFDARRKGYARWCGMPMSERDAFKAEYRIATHDGGGERSGQIIDGPPRVGDVVKVLEWSEGSMHFGVREAGFMCTVETWDANFFGSVAEKARGFGYLRTMEEPQFNQGCRVEVLRRAVQPEAKAVLPIDAEDERVVDALVNRKTAGRAETPLLGPHAGTVADIVKWLERMGGSYWEKICAERAKKDR